MRSVFFNFLILLALHTIHFCFTLVLFACTSVLFDCTSALFCFTSAHFGCASVHFGCASVHFDCTSEHFGCNSHFSASLQYFSTALQHFSASLQHISVALQYISTALQKISALIHTFRLSLCFNALLLRSGILQLSFSVFFADVFYRFFGLKLTHNVPRLDAVACFYRLFVKICKFPAFDFPAKENRNEPWRLTAVSSRFFLSVKLKNNFPSRYGTYGITQ